MLKVGILIQLDGGIVTITLITNGMQVNGSISETSGTTLMRMDMHYRINGFFIRTNGIGSQINVRCGTLDG